MCNGYPDSRRPHPFGRRLAPGLPGAMWPRLDTPGPHLHSKAPKSWVYLTRRNSVSSMKLIVERLTTSPERSYIAIETDHIETVTSAVSRVAGNDSLRCIALHLNFVSGQKQSIIYGIAPVDGIDWDEFKGRHFRNFLSLIAGNMAVVEPNPGDD